MSTVHEQWEEFETHVLDVIGVSDLERRNMRRAFYAGAGAMLTAILNVEDEADLWTLRNECAAFARDVRQNRD